MPNSLTRIATGQVAFEGGIDGGRIPLLASSHNPTGLKYNQLSWLVNGTVRGGGITPRTGWFPLIQDFVGDDGWFQGATVYIPDEGYPYMIFAVSGHLYRVMNDATIQELTTPGVFLWAGAQRVWFCQAEQFLLVQDGVTAGTPLVWEDSQLRSILNMPGAGPAATMLQTGQAMDYYMGRVWVAQGREYMAGDIVGGPSGNAVYGFRDSVLHATENQLFLGGGSFIVPTVSGNIRAMAHTANLDSALGEGQLFIFTRNTIYSVNVTPSRAEWMTLSEPLQRVAQQRYGAISERSIVSVNGDLFYQSWDGIRSLMVAIRYFHQWGQTPLSHNINRILQYNNRGLLSFSSGIEFDNRLLQTALPVTTPVGIAHQALVTLDFDLITSLEEKLPPVWEGQWAGLDHLQLVEMDYGGLQRAFSFVHSRVTGRIQIWEISQANKFEMTDNRNTMVIEFPAFHFDDPFELKELDNGELWIDKLFGTVDFTIYYRQDQNPCWITWYAWQECAARTTCEDVDNPVCYPEQRSYCEQNRITIILPKAPSDQCDIGNHKLSTWGYSFQVKLEVRGWCRIRGLRLWAFPRDREPYKAVHNTT